MAGRRPQDFDSRRLGQQKDRPSHNPEGCGRASTFGNVARCSYETGLILCNISGNVVCQYAPLM